MKPLAVGAAVLLALGSFADGQEKRRGRPRAFLMGLGGMPYDLTAEAVEQTRQFVHSHADLVTVKQEDGGIPWAEALEGIAFPAPVEQEWKGARDAVPPGYKVLLALSPVNYDTGALLPSRGAAKNLPVPPQLRDKPLDHRDVIQAFYAYSRRAVEAVQPDYLLLGIECTKLVQNNAKAWPAFCTLVRAVRDRLKKDHPKLMIGVSHDLMQLWNQQVARAVQPTLRHLDFLGITFFPYAGKITEITGGRALPRGRNQWVSPFGWLKKFTRLPVAVCGTGYASRELSVPAINLELEGSEAAQKAYVTDLLRFAERDRWLFVVWTFPVDLDRLAKRFTSDVGQFLNVMKNNGFVDSAFQPKPALEVWDRELRRNPKPE